MDYDEEIMKSHFRVAIFGSKSIEKQKTIYKQIFNLATKLAEEDIDIVTGGGPGLMRAARDGHFKGRKSGKTKVIGLTIQLERKESGQYHLDVVKDFAKFSNRIDNFLNISNAFVVASGGVGTLLELFFVWQNIQVNKVEKRPIIFFGSMWQGLLDWIKQEPLKKRLLDPKDLDVFYHAKTVNDVMKIIKNSKMKFDAKQDDVSKA